MSNYNHNIPDDIVGVGKDILRSVTDAIDRNDYSNLASDISETVRNVTSDRYDNRNISIKARTTYASGGEGRIYRQQAKAEAARVKIPFLQKKVSKFKGILEVFLAVAGVFMVVPPAVVLAMAFGSVAATGVVAGVLVGACAFLGIKGIKDLTLAMKYYEYGKLLGNAEYFKISDLAKASVKSDKEVLKDIKEMIKKEFLPRAHLDSTQQTCMITDEAYQLYLGAEQDRNEREKRELENKKAGAASGDENISDEVRKILDEGREYISFVRQTNDVIPDTEEMSDKLYRLEDIMNKIFAQVRKDPQSAGELRRLMNYYLPTTRKLLTAYVELDKQNVSGENVDQTKKEIDAAMDTINGAFEKLLDSMFQDMAWDISSDISVMKTMLAQDGLTSEGSPMAMQAQTK